jgi:hypothetical protein
MILLNIHMCMQYLVLVQYQENIIIAKLSTSSSQILVSHGNQYITLQIMFVERMPGRPSPKCIFFNLFIHFNKGKNIF